MSDNPFGEPDDTDRTVIRPAAGSRAGGASTVRRPPAEDEATRLAPPPLRPRPVPLEAAQEAAELPVAPAASGVSPLLAAAAPLLQLLSRLRNTLTPPDPGDLRERSVREVRSFEERARTAGVPPHLLRLGHYALCASLDDVVLNTPWGSTGVWDARSLVSTFHQEVSGGERFFEILGQARQNPGRFLPVLELMYHCLSLGFMGRYRLSPRGPAEIDQLREDIYALVGNIRPRPEPDLSPSWRGVVAPYRPARARVPLWVAGSVGLALLGGMFIWFSSGLNAASDNVYEQALRIPPDTMPIIERQSPVRPPAPAPASAEPGTLDRLRTFLKPEVDAGLVEVLGTETTPVVRVRQGGLFGSGSATLQARALPVLERIGLALKAEPGPVQVIGYTDNEPIRTVRFPSNFQLSAARAEAARDVLARTIGTPSRLSAEGRADADPIASNATPEGRDANRRIEIVLQRQS